MEAAVLAVKNAPPRAPDDAAFLPDDQSLDGRTWIHVSGTDDDDGASRDVLDAALASLGRAGS